MSSNLTVELVQSHSAGAQRVVADNVHAVDPESTTGRQFAALTSLTGLPMVCIDQLTGRLLGHPAATQVAAPYANVPVEVSRKRQIDIVEIEPGVLQYALLLPPLPNLRPVALGYALTSTPQQPLELVLAAAQNDWSQADLDAWVAATPRLSQTLLERLLSLAVSESAHEELSSSLQAEVEDLTQQIQYTYEEISLLHSLTHNMQISRTPRELAETCVNRMQSIIVSAGTAVYIEERRGANSFLAEGEIPFDEAGMSRLIARFDSHDWSRPVVKNHIGGTLLGADFPGLNNLVIVPIAEGSHRFGWIVSCNKLHGEEFGTVEANLLNSLGTILGTHIRNINLYQQHEDLLISFVRSLVSSLDAKDPYTRGHSERVALIARRIGQQMGLPETDLHDIYLSGLLHDVGKIGVDDRILQKPGKLTDDEFKQIQEHPMIGYNILKGLRNLQKVLPGVRSHHEAYNGKGYPDRLAGEDIPLMARILAVADSYDAMGSDRPYREGMPTEKIEEIFRRGSGEQWDARVIDCYFDAREDVQTICDTYSPANGNLLPKEDSDDETV